KRKLGAKVKICPSCEKQFATTRSQQVYCSTPCKSKAERENTTRERKCLRCGSSFLTNHPTRKFCSKKCRYSTGVSDIRANSSTIGAIGELVAATDLMRRRYEVFRALSPDSSRDLIALKNSITRRVEVRVGHRLEGGKLQYPTSIRACDFVAVVVDF